MAVRAKQGRPIYGVRMTITDDEGKSLPRDGVAFGHLKVTGPWVMRPLLQRARLPCP